MIFGALAPKFQVSGTDVLLDYAVIEKNEPDYKNIVHESDLDRERNVISRPTHHDFEVLIHLHRYADPKAKYDEIMAQLSATCKVWKHREFEPFQDSAGADATFVLLEAMPFYITTTDYADGLRLKFVSTSDVDISDVDDNWTMARTLSSGSSNAWYLDPTSGLYVEAADTATSRRLPAGKFKGTCILIDGSSTNILQESGDFGTTWTATNMTPSTDTSETDDIYGTATADKLTATAANGNMQYVTTGVNIGTDDGAFSAFVKSSNAEVGGILKIKRNDTAALLVQQAFTAVPNGPEPFGFTRFYVAHESGASYATEWLLEVEVTTDTEEIYIIGAQLEVGTDVLFPSAIMPTNGANTARNSELFLHPASGLISRYKGWISFWFKPRWIYNKHATATLFQSGANASNRHIHITVTSAGNFSCAIFRDNSTTSAGDISTSASGVSQDTWHHLVYVYDATVATGQKLYFDGVLLDTSANTESFNISDIGTNLALGSAIDGTQPAFCYIDEFCTDKILGIGPTLTADQVAEIYNMPGGLPRTLI